MSDNFILPWGKHKGEEIESIPSDYLKWLAENCEDDLVATEADEEYQWRKDTGGHFWD